MNWPSTRTTPLEELQTIDEELPDRYKLMALLAVWCAMRFGELAELRRGDIDLRTKPDTGVFCAFRGPCTQSPGGVHFWSREKTPSFLDRSRGQSVVR